MFNKPVRSVHDFLLSTYFADGLRITFGIIFPSLVLAQFGLLKFGMTLSLGALCVSVVDSPGPIIHRKNAMMVTTVLISLLSFLVGLTNRNLLFIGILLPIGSFIFSMFSLYGTRAASIGTAALLVIVFSVEDLRPWQEVSLHAGLVFLGSAWYSVLSYTIYRLRPYRIVQQTLSESIHEVADFLRAKAKFYHQNIDYEKNYADLLQLQVHVHEEQESVRELLFKTREIVRESTPEGRFLMLVFVDMVDLFEQVMSTYYNYQKLHDQFDSSGILKKYEIVINHIADELEQIAFALKTGGTPGMPAKLIKEVAKLKESIIELENNNTNGQYNTLGIVALKNIEVNIENILTRVKTIMGYFKEKKNLKRGNIDTEKFITHQNIDAKLLWENLTFKSSTFRHSMRVAIVMLLGFIISKALPFSHSYWILLTILVISKPGFSLTKQRNYERILGTIMGAFVGLAALHFVNDKNMLFMILLVSMVLSYSFQRKNYVVSVLFMTPYVLILFDFLGMGSVSVASERIIDTIIGSGLAFLASYTLFPNWEHEKLKGAMINTLKANANYFEQVTLLYFAKTQNSTDYKVARKEVYVTTANLASLFQRMFSEPKSKQLLIKEIHQFTALNHLLSSYVATLSLYNKEHSFSLTRAAEFKPIINNTLYLINLASSNLDQPSTETSNVPLVRLKFDENQQERDMVVIGDLLELIQKVTYDIFKLTEKVKFHS